MDRESNPARRSADQSHFDDIWHDDRRYLLGVASSMLRDHAEAEDVVQEAFGRLMRVELDEIHDLRAWLAVVVRRMCLNRLQSAYIRRESATGTEPPQPGLPVSDHRDDDPADRVTLDDQVQLALAVILDQLTPAERTSFVLHDVFRFPYETIGELVGRTTIACRQLASRARRTIQAEAPSVDADMNTTDEHSLLVERFVAACAGGNIADLIAVLDPHAYGEATLPGPMPLIRVEGAQAVATRAIELFGPETGAHLVPVPIEGAPGIVVTGRGRFRAVIKLDVASGVVRYVRAFVIH